MAGHKKNLMYLGVSMEKRYKLAIVERIHLLVTITPKNQHVEIQTSTCILKYLMSHLL